MEEYPCHNYRLYLDEFINEYDDYRNPAEGKFMGIEFSYSGNFYRMCREPLDVCKQHILDDGTMLEYDVMLIHNYLEDNFFYTWLGWYKDLDDVLENCEIDGRKFRDVIMDDKTEILGQD